MTIFYIADHRFIPATPLGSADGLFIRINKDFIIIFIITTKNIQKTNYIFKTHCIRYTCHVLDVWVKSNHVKHCSEGCPLDLKENALCVRPFWGKGCQQTEKDLSGRGL